ncbi:MAG: LuxR C-terminal-related transcriptional regulator [Nitrospirota bacterium]
MPVQTGLSKKVLSPYQRKVVCAIEALAASPISREEKVRRFFAVLRTTISFHAAALLFFCPASGRIVGAVLENLDHRYLYPLVRCLRTKRHSMQSRPVIRGSEASVRCVYHEARLAETVLDPNRLGASLIGSVQTLDGSRIGQFCVWRIVGQPDFSKVDVAFAASLTVALGRALDGGFNPGDETGELQPLGVLAGRRGHPGVLVVDHEGRLASANREALDLIELLEAQAGGQAGPMTLPRVLAETCHQVLERPASDPEGGGYRSSPSPAYLCSLGGEKFSIRCTMLQAIDRSSKPHVLILIERIRQTGIDLGRVVAQFGLTPREIAVAQAIALGQTNKEIAGALELSEYTIKEHIKRIMPKLGVTTRSGISSVLARGPSGSS